MLILANFCPLSSSQRCSTSLNESGLRILAGRIECIGANDRHFLNYGVTAAFGIDEFAFYPTRLMIIHEANDFYGEIGHGVLASDSGVGLAAEELAGAGAAGEFAGVDDYAAAGQDCFGGAFDGDAFEHGIVDAHVVGFGADDFFVIGVEDNQVGVGAHGDGAFAGVEAEKFCGGGGDELDEAIWGKVFAMNAAGVDEA